MILALYSVYQGYTDSPNAGTFIKAYLQESVTRSVMWWKRAGVDSKDFQAVFAQTKVSREICMFQQMVRHVLVGANVSGTLQAVEDSNCRLSMRLEELQGRWRQQKAEVASWPLFFECLGVPRPECDSISAWLV